VADSARQISIDSLEGIRRLCSEHGAALAIVTLPFEAQVYALRETEPNYDIGLPQRYVEDYARPRGIPYLSLLPQLRSLARSAGEPLYVDGDPHFNDHGHRIAGQYIAKWFRREVERRSD
jgi:hypothetical protein